MELLGSINHLEHSSLLDIRIVALWTSAQQPFGHPHSSPLDIRIVAFWTSAQQPFWILRHVSLKGRCGLIAAQHMTHVSVFPSCSKLGEYIVQQQTYIFLYICMGFISKECSFYLNFNNSMQFLHYQSLSGLGFNKLGFYEQCIAEPQNQFYLIEGKSNQYIAPGLDNFKVFMSGVCFNQVCSASDLHYALASADQYTKLPYKLLKIETPSLIEQPLNLQDITVITIISVLILLFLVCSAMDCLKKMKKLNRQTKITEIFSIFTTFRLLESRSQRNNQRVKIFSGLKTLSLVGIMLINVGMVAYNAPTTSIYSQTQRGSIFVSFYAVDIWLLVSGFFLSYLLLKQYSKQRSIKILMLKIVRRFGRLWPIYVLGLLLSQNIVPLVGNGPLWPLLIQHPKQYCRLDFTNLLMVSNLFKSECYNWLWLLELDFQLCCIFIPTLLLYINKEQRICKFLFHGVQLTLVLCSFAVALLLLETQYLELTDYFFHVEYSRVNILPITRCTGFIIGYNLGILFHEFKKMGEKKQFWVIRQLQSRVCRMGMPLASLAALTAILMVFDSFEKDCLQPWHIFFFTSLHAVVPLLTAVAIVPSLFGYCSPLKRLLQCWLCNLLSKLSITLYASHFMTTMFIIYYRQYDLELSSFMMIFLAFCTVLPSLLIAILLTTIVEIPVFVCKKVFWKTERITYFEH